ncbi:unnamed protein product [Linum tenue]|uniref:Uncharacterized protein n=1 Tax=Linum tenue TaxID=586396 RepID=A0AAV0HH71_9ROSI|nr:unnamed protein product [Linum tenue]
MEMCIRSSEGTAVSNASSSQPEVSSAKLKSLVSTLLDSADQQPLEVFPRFKGPDVHKSFADCLYSCLVRSKIRTFRNAEELHDHKDRELSETRCFQKMHDLLRDLDRAIVIEEDVKHPRQAQQNLVQRRCCKHDEKWRGN